MVTMNYYIGLYDCFQYKGAITVLYQARPGNKCFIIL